MTPKKYSSRTRACNRLDPAGFLLCKFYVARLNSVLVFSPPYGIMVKKEVHFMQLAFSWSLF